MKAGEWYEFTVGNHLELPGQKAQIILTGPGGVRYLIPAEPYVSYGLVPGSGIRCKVDKINCSGRIFLEPEHPFYHENKTYTFYFKRKESRVNVLSYREYFWVLRDNVNNEIDLRVEPVFYGRQPSEKLECRVARIKKGKLALQHAYSVKPPGMDKTGQWKDFIIMPSKADINNEDYYILQEDTGEKHLLKAKHFEVFNLVQGQAVSCKFVKWSQEGRWVLEPRHPVYTEGDIYPFTILDVEENITDEQEWVFNVPDVNGNKIQVIAPSTAKKDLLPGKTVGLRVIELRKGKPVLEWIDDEVI